MTTPVPDYELALDSVSHSFRGSADLFTDVSYAFERGAMYAIVGPSGSGKSTLLHILSGWLAPSSGVVTRVGFDSLQWVFQNPFGVGKRTAADLVALPLIARGSPRNDAAKWAQRYLGDMGLARSAHKQFRSLSGGEAQRVMLARALAARPDLLLIDEPTAQLDFETTAAVNRVIANASTNESIVIVATHDSDTKSKCDFVLDLGDYHAHR